MWVQVNMHHSNNALKTVALLGLLSAILVLVLGTLVIFTFDPCIDPSSTLSVCTGR